MRETWFRSLGREDPLEKEMATHSSTLAWRIPWREKPGRLTFRSLIHFELIFLMFCEKIVLISFTCSCAVFLAPLIKETVFPVVYSYLLCHRLIDDKYLGLFLSFLVCSRDLCACLLVSLGLPLWVIFWLRLSLLPEATGRRALCKTSLCVCCTLSISNDMPCNSENFISFWSVLLSTLSVLSFWSSH